ncbi:MAG TPA: DedA family protein [Symbiobacteriaceae bacterium]|nr:DedA family protein [Symbiobacteriaceae bacterium]
MLFALEGLFSRHIYMALLTAGLIEGVGLPLPAEVLFVAAGLAVHRGHASLGTVVLAATLGNLAGNLLGFGVAYMGGQKLVQRIARTIRLKPEATQSVERFFHKYGAGTVFMSRFIGFIRAATIYSAGAARMAPWRFALYATAAALVWNAGWAWLAFRFGAALPRLIHRVVGQSLVWLVTVLAVLLVGALLFRWVRRRNVVGP